MTTNHPDAVAVLKKFIAEMHDWEAACAAEDEKYEDDEESDLSAISAGQHLKCDAIFSRYCTRKDRKQGRNGSYAMPPRYNASEEVTDIEEKNSKKLVITTQQHTGMKDKVRYTLLFAKGEWRLDHNERYSSYENKWVKANL